MSTNDVVFFGVGSPLIYEYEETARRLGLNVMFGVRNVDADVQCSDDVKLRLPTALSQTDLSIPFMVPLFTPRNRVSGVRDAESLGFQRAATLIDPTAIVASNSYLPSGGFVNAATVIGTDCTFGRHVIINRKCAIGHHNKVGDFVSIGPGVTTCGNVNIGQSVLIGAGSIILPSVSIGDGAVIGAGSVIVKDVEPYTKVVTKRDLRITPIGGD